MVSECDLEPADRSSCYRTDSGWINAIRPLCLYKAMDLIDRSGFGTQDYHILPMHQPCSCVSNYPQ